MRYVSFDQVMASIRREFRERCETDDPLPSGEVRRCPKCGQRCRLLGECRGRLIGTCRCSFTPAQWEGA
jgi:hypothetical protein